MATILDIFSRVLETGKPVHVKDGIHSVNDSLTEFRARSWHFGGMDPRTSDDLRLHAEPSTKGEGWRLITRQVRVWIQG